MRGHTISGFTIQQELGNGALGKSYLATPDDGGDKVVIKIAEEASYIEGLEELAAKVNSLNLPNVAQYIEQGTDGEGISYLLSQYQPGEALSDTFIQSEEPMAEGQAFQTFWRILNALIPLHDQGVSHGSIRPENIILGEKGDIFLVDVGLTDVVLDKNPDAYFIYIYGKVIGRKVVQPFRYFSPARNEGKPSTPKDDIFSLGVLLYQLFTGEVPAENAPSQFGGKLEFALEKILMRMIGDVSRRHSHARELLEDLKSVEDSLSFPLDEVATPAQSASSFPPQNQTRQNTSTTKLHVAKVGAPFSESTKLNAMDMADLDDDLDDLDAADSPPEIAELDDIPEIDEEPMELETFDLPDIDEAPEAFDDEDDDRPALGSATPNGESLEERAARLLGAKSQTGEKNKATSSPKQSSHEAKAKKKGVLQSIKVSKKGKKKKKEKSAPAATAAAAEAPQESDVDLAPMGDAGEYDSDVLSTDLMSDTDLLRATSEGEVNLLDDAVEMSSELLEGIEPLQGDGGDVPMSAAGDESDVDLVPLDGTPEPELDLGNGSDLILPGDDDDGSSLMHLDIDPVGAAPKSGESSLNINLDGIEDAGMGLGFDEDLILEDDFSSPAIPTGSPSDFQDLINKNSLPTSLEDSPSGGGGQLSESTDLNLSDDSDLDFEAPDMDLNLDMDVSMEDPTSIPLDDSDLNLESPDEDEEDLEAMDPAEALAFLEMSKQSGTHQAAGGGNDAPATTPAAGSPLAGQEGTGSSTLMLTGLRSSAKKEKAAALIAEMRGIDEDDALAMTKKPLIKVLKDVPEEVAKDAQKQFKEIGITGRVTTKKK